MICNNISSLGIQSFKFKVAVYSLTELTDKQITQKPPPPPPPPPGGGGTLPPPHTQGTTMIRLTVDDESRAMSTWPNKTALHVGVDVIYAPRWASTRRAFVLRERV